jgi:hypothetical protein
VEPSLLIGLSSWQYAVMFRLAAICSLVYFLIPMRFGFKPSPVLAASGVVAARYWRARAESPNDSPFQL